MIQRSKKLTLAFGLSTLGFVAGGCDLLTGGPQQGPGVEQSDCTIDSQYRFDCTPDDDDLGFTANQP